MYIYIHTHTYIPGKQKFVFLGRQTINGIDVCCFSKRAYPWYLLLPASCPKFDTIFGIKYDFLIIFLRYPLFRKIDRLSKIWGRAKIRRTILAADGP